MDGIGASLESAHELTLHYKFINDEGKVSVLEGPDLFMANLKCILLIPQDNLMKIQRIGNKEGYFTVISENYVLKISD